MHLQPSCNRASDGWMDGWMDGVLMDGEMDGWMDGWMDVGFTSVRRLPS